MLKGLSKILSHDILTKTITSAAGQHSNANKDAIVFRQPIWNRTSGGGWMKKALIWSFGLALPVLGLFAQADERAALRGAIGPSFSFLVSFDLDEKAFANLVDFTAEFDITDASNKSLINGSTMLVTGFEGFGEITPHWTLGMFAGQGDYSALAQDAAKVDYGVQFVLSQVGVTAEFNTNARSRLNLLGGTAIGLGQATLAAQSSPENETWTTIIAGDSTRQAFEVSAWMPLLQPYLGMRFDISRSMGFKAVAGWNQQAVKAGGWRLYNMKVISDSPEVALSALFFRFQLYVLL